MRSVVFFTLSLCGAAIAVAQQPVADPAAGVNFYSIEKEIALGKALADDVVRQSQIVNDPALAAYLEGIAQKLWRNAASEIPLVVWVIEDDSFNSFVLPGGFLFVNTGLLEALDTEAELAAVLSHQMGHVAARHGTKQETRGQIVNLASVPLIFQGGWTGYGIREASQVAIPLGFLTFSRAFEHQADALGLQYLYAAGYETGAYLRLFEKLQTLEQANPARVSRVFSTHPPVADRITRTQEGIASLTPRAEDTVSTPEFEQMKARLMAREKPAAPPVLDAPPAGQRFI